MLQGYIFTHTIKVQNILQALFREIAYSILTRHVLYTTDELTQLYISSLFMISAFFILFIGWKESWFGQIWKFRCFLVFCIRNKPPKPYHCCLSLAEVNSLIQIFVNILQLVSERYSALQRNESHCCFHFYTGDTAPARILPFTWRTSQRSFRLPDCHPSLPFPPSSTLWELQDSIFLLSYEDRPRVNDVAWSLEKEGKQNPSKTKPVPITPQTLNMVPFVPAAPSYYCVLSCHDFFGGKLPMQSVSTVGTAQFYKHKVLWLHWFPS